MIDIALAAILGFLASQTAAFIQYRWNSKSEAGRQVFESDRFNRQLEDGRAREAESRKFADVLDWRSRRLQAYGDVVGLVRSISQLNRRVQRGAPLDSLPPGPTWMPQASSAEQYLSVCRAQISAAEPLVANLAEKLDVLSLLSTLNTTSAGEALIAASFTIRKDIEAAIWIWEQVAEGKSVLEDEVIVYDQDDPGTPVSGFAATSSEIWAMLRGYARRLDESVDSFEEAAKNWRNLTRAELAVPD